MKSSNTITARDLVVDYATANGTIRALECQSLSVQGGASIAVMGASGCGKSTLLGLLAGLALPSSGSITIGTSTISSLSELERVQFRRRHLGMVYQADNLLPFLTIKENVSLQLGISENSQPHHAPGDLMTLLERLGLGGLAERLPDQLSGGQRQRAAVARAVIHKPSVILADEPTGALDAKTAGTVIELLIDAQREIGATLIVVTHDPGIASYLDRIVQLEPPLTASEPANAC